MGLSSPPTLPVVVARLLALCADEDFSVAEMVRTVEADPAISSRLLRLANSAYYGLSRRIGTLDQAVVTLGRFTVQALALGHTLLRSWAGKGLPPAVETLWVHAYLCGLGCRHLAQRLPRAPHLSHPDTLFLTGLLHDIGKIQFLAEAPEPYREVLERAPPRQELLAWETEHFGCDHAEAGGNALDGWQIPFAIAAVVRYHHSTGLRAELQSDWQVLRAVDDFVGGLEPADSATGLPPGLLADFAPHMERFTAEAKAFYQAIQ